MEPSFSADTPAAQLIREVESQALAISDNLAKLLETALRFAKADGKELVVDIEALVSALLQFEAGKPGIVASDWIREWAVGEGLDFGLRSTPDVWGLTSILSRSVKGRVLSRAIAIRDRTMNGQLERLGLRHLLFALAEQPPSAWPALQGGGRPSTRSLLALQSLVAKRVAAQPLAGEDAQVWLALPGTPGEIPQTPPSEATPFLSDSPAAVDHLGRRPLMQALARRLVREQSAQASASDPAAMMVHLYGAWGSGKSSMVRLLADALQRESPRWLVVEFNAWRNARVKPPWWNMLTEMHRVVSRRLLADVMPLRWAWLQLRWGWISPSVDNVVLVAAGLAVLALVLLGGQSGAAVAAMNRLIGPQMAALKDVPTLLTLFTGFAATLVAGIRGVLLGGKRVADNFDALRTDSYRPFIGLFRLLTRSAPGPMLIVLDDLDRCDAGSVTDLLEGIQTLFRDAPVVFLAVGDRPWITRSFARRYADFDGVAGNQARMVEDLFLDKMFQLSVGVPQIGREVQTAYLQQILGGGRSGPAQAPPPLPPDILTLEAGQQAIRAAPEAMRGAVRAQVALRLTEQRADNAIEHRLVQWSRLIEPNPRAMKRLVNAVGMAQTRALLEGRDVGFDTIALWTMLEQRWPRAADAIIADPKLIDPDEPTENDALAVAWREKDFALIAGRLKRLDLVALFGLDPPDLLDELFDDPA